MACGIEIGRGRPLSELTGPGTKLVEGAPTAAVAIALGKRHGVELPICQTVAAIIEGQMDVNAAVRALMSRPLKRES
mgnify:CR=1 FL=1